MPSFITVAPPKLKVRPLRKFVLHKFRVVDGYEFVARVHLFHSGELWKQKRGWSETREGAVEAGNLAIGKWEKERERHNAAVMVGMARSDEWETIS